MPVMVLGPGAEGRACPWEASEGAASVPHFIGINLHNLPDQRRGCRAGSGEGVLGT